MDLLLHFIFCLAIYPIKRLYWLAFDKMLPQRLSLWPWGFIALLVALIGWALIPLWIILGYLFAEKIGMVMTFGDERWEIISDLPELECIPEVYLSLGNLYYVVWLWGVIVLGVYAWLKSQSKKINQN